MVGSDMIADLFFEVIQQYESPLSVGNDPIVKEGSSIFGRDWGIVGLNHTYHIPYPLANTQLLSYEFRAHLPSDSDFVDGPKGGFGRGFYD
jgi:hypothetical protein